MAATATTRKDVRAVNWRINIHDERMKKEAAFVKKDNTRVLFLDEEES